MEGIAEINRRLSILSAGGPVKDEDVQKIRKSPPPLDTFFLVHILFLLLGLISLLPINFFITANDYWMYKFRDPSANSTDANHRNTLQKDYAPAQMIAQAVPTFLSSVLSTRYGHKIKLKNRIVGGLLIESVIFAIFTILIKVNTDSWQVGFFALTMLGIAALNAVHGLMLFSFLLQLAKFPQRFMKAYMYGQGTSGIFSAVLQIISIAVGNGNSETVALIYFLSGFAVIVVTVLFFSLSNKLSLFRYYNDLKGDDIHRAARPLSELKPVLKKVWPACVVGLTALLSIYIGHPTITSLVVSENHNSTDAWNKSYFVPVVTFLYGEILNFAGRFFATPIITEKNGLICVALSVLRVAVFLPLLYLCNAYPRDHLSVVFTHDWEYMIILGILTFTIGYLMTTLFLSIPELSKGDEEIGLELLNLFIGAGIGMLAPLGLVVVNIL